MMALYELEEIADKLGLPFSEYCPKYKRKSVTDLIREKNIECVKLGRTIKLNEFQFAKLMEACTCHLRLSQEGEQETYTSEGRAAEKAYTRALKLATEHSQKPTGSTSKTRYKPRTSTAKKTP